MMWYWGGGLHWWGWLLGFIGMVVFWGLVIWAIWYVVLALTRRPHSDQRPSDAKRILDERLARGEIDADEYRHLRQLIGSDMRQPGSSFRPPDWDVHEMGSHLKDTGSGGDRAGAAGARSDEHVEG